MNTIRLLENERKQLSEKKKLIEEKLAEYPPGSLIFRQNGKYQKWFVLENGTRLYLPKKEKETAIRLAEKELLCEQLKEMMRREEALQKCIDLLQRESYSSISEVQRSLSEILPEDYSREQTEKEIWANTPYHRSVQKPEKLIIPTLSGIMVRSKSEMLIADALFRAGIPFRYEPELILGGNIFHPDFLIYSHSREIIWEHMGLLSDDSYMRINMNKISSFVAFGYFPGDTLIITSEKKEHVLTNEQIDRIIECFLL